MTLDAEMAVILAFLLLLAVSFSHEGLLLYLPHVRPVSNVKLCNRFGTVRRLKRALLYISYQ